MQTGGSCLGGSHWAPWHKAIHPLPLCRVGLAIPGHPIRVLQPPPSMGLPTGSLTNLSPAERPQGEGTECTRPPASLPHLGTSEDILCVDRRALGCPSIPVPCSFIPSHPQPFSKYLLSTCYVPLASLGAGNMVVSDKVLALIELTLQSLPIETDN